MFEAGYLGLFLASFLAATVVPFSSEALLSGMLAANYDLYSCLALATVGQIKQKSELQRIRKKI